MAPTKPTAESIEAQRALKDRIQASTVTIAPKGPLEYLQLIGNYLTTVGAPQLVMDAYEQLGNHVAWSANLSGTQLEDVNDTRTDAWLGDGDQRGCTVEQSWG